MKEMAQEVVLWGIPIVQIILIVLVTTRKGLRGKLWLLTYLVGSLLIGMVWWTPWVLTKLDIFDQESVLTFYDWLPLPVNTLTLVILCFLVPYVLSASTVPSIPKRRRVMTIGEALFSFDGRMSRSDYWLKGMLILFPFAIVNNCLAFVNETARMVSIIVAVLSLWPGIALHVKRLHDRNRSAWIMLLILIPFLGIIFAIWLIIEEWFLKGTDGPNRFGEDPLGSTSLTMTEKDDYPQHLQPRGTISGSPFYDCPHCGAGGIIPDEDGKCTSCRYTLEEEQEQTRDSYSLMMTEKDNCTQNSSVQDDLGNGNIDADVGFHKAADEHSSFTQNSPESILEAESDNDEVTTHSQGVYLGSPSESTPHSSDLSSARSHHETTTDRSPIRFTDCPHCSTRNVLPMPGHICPNCKKPLSELRILMHRTDCPNCDTRGVLPMKGNICPNCKKPLA